MKNSARDFSVMDPTSMENEGKSMTKLEGSCIVLSQINHLQFQWKELDYKGEYFSLYRFTVTSTEGLMAVCGYRQHLS